MGFGEFILHCFVVEMTCEDSRARHNNVPHSGRSLRGKWSSFGAPWRGGLLIGEFGLWVSDFRWGDSGVARLGRRAFGGEGIEGKGGDWEFDHRGTEDTERKRFLTEGKEGNEGKAARTGT